MGQLRGRDASAAIPDDDIDLTRCGARARGVGFEANRARSRCKLECVGEQVGKHLLEHVGVAVDPEWLDRRLDLKMNSTALGQRGECKGRVFQEHRQIHPLGTKFHLTRFELCDIEDLVDQAQQKPAVSE